MSTSLQVTKESSLTAPEDRNMAEKWRPESHVPPLDQEQTVNAMKEQNVTSFRDRFPHVDRTYADPPIQLQKIGLFSFTPAKGAKPNESGVYGYAKLRGNFATTIESDQKAEELIRNVDSYNKIYHTYVGRPFPITLSSNYSAEVTEVDMKKQMAESISSNIKSIKQDEEKQIAEIKQREEELLAESEKAKKGEATEEPYDVYVTKQVKRAQLCWTYLEHMKKMDEVRAIIMKTRRELAEMDKEHPTFRTSYYEKYMDARKKSGLDNKVRNDQDNFIKYMVEDVFLPGIDDLPQNVEPVSPPVPPVGYSKYNPDSVPEQTLPVTSPSVGPITATSTPKKKKAKKTKK